MFGQILVNYAEINNEISRLRSLIDAENSLMLERYKQIMDALENQDGATNNSLKTAMGWNRHKALTTAEVLSELLAFMENAAATVEARERQIVSVFALLPIQLKTGRMR